MTLLLGEVTTLLVSAILWLAAAIAFAAIPALALLPGRRRSTGAMLRVAVLVGIAATGVASRLGLGDPLAFEVLGRPLLVSWLLAGACLGAGVVAWRRRHRS